jgi:hypothetical protein
MAWAINAGVAINVGGGIKRRGYIKEEIPGVVSALDDITIIIIPLDEVGLGIQSHRFTHKMLRLGLT